MTYLTLALALAASAPPATGIEVAGCRVFPGWAILPDGAVYVADAAGQRIHKFVCRPHSGDR